MSNNKKDIHSNKDKLLHCYFPQQRHEKKLIPDTMVARKKAKNEGASHFDTLSFCRHQDTGIQEKWQFGDLYINIHGPCLKDDKHQFDVIKETIVYFFEWELKIDIRSIRFNILAGGGIGIQIPAWILRLEDGTDLLLYIYLHITFRLSRHCEINGIEKITFQYNPLIEVNNTVIDNLSNSLNAEEFLSGSYDELIEISKRGEQPYKDISLSKNAQRIPLGIKIKIINAAREKRTDEKISQLFQYCPFLNDKLATISEKKATPVIDSKTTPAIDEQANAPNVMELESAPVDNMHKASPTSLRKVLQKINQKMGLNFSIDKWISPGDENLCDLLKSSKMCTYEKCSRKHPAAWDLENNNTLEEINMPDAFPANGLQCIRAPILFSLPAPSNQKEAYQRLALRHVILQKLPKVLKSLFQGGQRSAEVENWFVFKNWVVFLDTYHCDEANSPLDYFPPGGWVNQTTHRYGLDVISLYCDVFVGIQYDKAINRLTKHLGLNLEEISAKQKDEKAWWVQEKEPLNFRYLPNKAFPDKQSNFEKYFSSSEMLIGVVEYYQNIFSEDFKIYHTLWKHHQSEILHWNELFPEKPYMLFNLHMIDKSHDIYKRHRDVPVVFVEDEMLAVQSQNQVDDVVYTTCPGGLINLPHADLSALRGRRVIVELTSHSREVQILPDFIKKAEDNGIKVSMVFDGRYNRKAEDDGTKFVTYEFKSSEHVTVHEKRKFNHSVTAEEFLKDFYKDGYVGTSGESQSARHGSSIIKPGEKIPGADKKREVLLHPEIIEEGYIVWLYAFKKVGKTLMALSIAYAIAKGNRQLCAWSSKKPKKVLYIFGEGKPDKIDKSIKKIMAGQNDTGEIPFSIIIDEKGTSRSFSILDPLWQEKNMKELTSYDLIIFDNLQCLTNNRVDEINLLMEFLNSLVKHNTAVLLLDHTSRKDEIQGSISKERLLDLSIKLEKTEQKKIIKVSYPAARYMDGDSDFLLRMVFTEDTFHFELVSQDADSGEIGTQDDIPKPSEPEKITKLARMLFLRDEVGMSQRKCEMETGISKSSFSKKLDVQRDDLKGEDLVFFNAEFERLKKNFSNDQDRNSPEWKKEFQNKKS